MPLALMPPEPVARAEPGGDLKFLPGSGMGGSSSQVTCRNLPPFTVILFSKGPPRLPFPTHNQGRAGSRAGRCRRTPQTCHQRCRGISCPPRAPREAGGGTGPQHRSLLSGLWEDRPVSWGKESPSPGAAPSAPVPHSTDRALPVRHIPGPCARVPAVLKAGATAGGKRVHAHTWGRFEDGSSRLRRGIPGAEQRRCAERGWGRRAASGAAAA